MAAGATAPSAAITPSTTPAVQGFEIVVASFRTEARAAAVAADVSSLGLPVRVRVSDGWQQVLCGPFGSRAEAEAARQRLDSASLTGAQIVRKERADRRISMNARLGLLAAAAFSALWFPHALDAQNDNSPALTGQVTSAEEGPMEGVLVSARRAGSTITTTVVSDRQGRYQFPRARLEPGEYTLRIRADRLRARSARDGDGSRAASATADLKLGKTRDLAAQLTTRSGWRACPAPTIKRRSCAAARTVTRWSSSHGRATRRASSCRSSSAWPAIRRSRSR